MKSNVTGPLQNFLQHGRASFVVGGQWGSEAKGAAAAWLAHTLAEQDHRFDIVTTNAGAQAGHTSVHKGKKRVVFHLPTAPLITEDRRSQIYLNAGSIIDPDSFFKEIDEAKVDVFIHPMAAVITPECKERENEKSSSQTKIASTRKGVGAALASKVERSGTIARDYGPLRQFIRRVDLNAALAAGRSVLVEVPQGVSLSLNHSRFYPHCTSRDCTVSSAMADANIHPKFYGQSMVVMRTYPIRVGNIVEEGKELGNSGGHYPDQEETSWDELGVEAEITTVTKRVRRVFTWSKWQLIDTMTICRPDILFLSFCNYPKDLKHLQKIIEDIKSVSTALGLNTKIIYQWGPSTDEVGEDYVR